MSKLHHHDPKVVSPKDRLDSATWRSDHVVAEKFVWPDEQRVSLRHDEFIMDSDNIHRTDQIPVIDLACLGLNLDDDDVHTRRRKRASLVSQVRDACLQWGFFHIINHGVPQGVVTGMRKQALQLFGLPFEEKLRVAKVPESFTGYGHATVKEEDSQPWSEGFYLSDFANATRVSRTLWAGANEEFA